MERLSWREWLLAITLAACIYLIPLVLSLVN